MKNALRQISAADRCTSRRGLTIFEVVLALGIFLGAMAALTQLVSTGVQASIRARLETQAVLRCESKLGEVLAGVQPMESAKGTFEDDQLWTWDVQIGTGPMDELLEILVTVNRESTSSMAAMTYQVRRYVRDPQVFIDASIEASTDDLGLGL